MNRNAIAGFILAAAVTAPEGAFAELNGEFGALRSSMHSGIFDSIVPAAAVPVRAARKRPSGPKSGLSAADEALAVRSARYLGASPALVRLAIAKSRKYGVDPRLVLAVIKKESNFNSNARSGADARGLMQVQPATARGVGVTGNLYSPANSLEAGIKYLRSLQHRFGNTPDALAAYNAGPGNMRFGRGYAGSVMALYGKLQGVR